MPMHREADVPQKYDHIDFRPPQAVADAAARGLDLRQKASPSNRGGLTPSEAGKAGIGSGVQRAVNLKNRDRLSPDTVRQMSRFFSRHEKNKAVGAENKGEPWNDKGYVAWLLWGGDPGQRWAEKVVAQMEAADQKSKTAGGDPWDRDNLDGFIFLVRGELDEGRRRVREWKLRDDQWEVIEGGDGPQVVLRNGEIRDLDWTVSQHAHDLFYTHKDAPDAGWWPLHRHYGKVARVANAWIRSAGSWGYMPWEGDAPLDAEYDVLRAVDKEPAYQKLREGVAKAQDVADFWTWVGAVYLVSDSLGGIAEDVGRSLVRVLRAMPRMPRWDAWVASWKNPAAIVEAHQLYLHDAEQAVRHARDGVVPLLKVHIGALRHQFMEGVRGRGIKVAARLSQRVFYRGQARDLPLRLNQDKVLWLALDPEPARTYGDPWYDRTDEGVLFKITLKPTAKIIDLMDLSDPVVRAFKEAVSDVRQYTWGPISDDMWASFADFGLIEGYRWARGFFRSKRVDGVLLRDSNAGLDHASVALFTLSAVASVEKETFSRAQRVASTWLAARARYQEKKEVPKADGTGTTTVYVYSEKQVQHRHREKAKRYEGLSKKIDKLRHQVESDITSDDPKTRLTALAVGLIDATFERVGNDTSAEDGHYGVTGWLKKHVTFGKGKVTVRYVGKSGVKHEKVVDDAKLVKALRDCCADKAPEDALLSFGKDDPEGLVRVTSRDVNAYLEPFDVTAKDVRGFHANREMQDQLRVVRKQGPKLPNDRKERDKVLKAEFKEALEATAEAVGHEPSTLRSQYLVPGLEDAYMKDGTVMDTMKKGGTASRVAAAYFRRQAEREFDPDSMTVQEIQAVLRGAGLGVGGSHATLVARLGALLGARELFRGKSDEEITAEMTVPRLREIFRGLGLRVSGNKPNLVRHLRSIANRVVVPTGPRKKEDASYYVLWQNPFTGQTEALSVASSRVGAERVRGSIEGRLQNAWWSASKHLDLPDLRVWIGGAAPDADGDTLDLIYEVARLENSAMGPALSGDTGRLRQITQAIERAKSRLRVATKSEGEKEEEEVERLVRPSPKLKPPRNDSRRERVQTEDEDTSRKDKDLSLNYKDVGG